MGLTFFSDSFFLAKQFQITSFLTVTVALLCILRFPKRRPIIGVALSDKEENELPLHFLIKETNASEVRLSEKADWLQY